MIDWEPRARALAEQLAGAGYLRDPAWQRAFARVPRHEFVPQFYEQTEPGRWRVVGGGDPDQHEHWLDAVYSGTTLVTAVEEQSLPADAGIDSFALAVSSSTLPPLMAEMLEDLDLRGDESVLEIGTGSGYNAALLCHRLGDDHVFSMDLRPDVTEAAERALAHVGYRPTVVTGDGAAGMPEHAPFDRIVATCAVGYIPPAWIEQLRGGGTLRADIRGTLCAGHLATLRRAEHTTVEGRFSTRDGEFMGMAHQLGVEPGRAGPTDPVPSAERSSTVGPELLHDRLNPFSFYTQLHLPNGTELRGTNTGGTRLIAPDGSWCDVEPDRHEPGSCRVTEGGPQRLWAIVEQAHERYTALGHPGWDRFGITATPTEQYFWLDDSEDGQSWPISTTGEP